MTDNASLLSSREKTNISLAVQQERTIFAHETGVIMNKQLIDILSEYFKNKPVDKVWIFGSFSRGEERPDSDIDIIVAITPNSKFSILDHSGMICDLERFIDTPS